MKRYIDADKLNEQLQALAYDDWNQGVSTSWADAYMHFTDLVDIQSTDDVRENVHGEWIEIPDEVFASTYKCSVCGCAPLSDGYDADYVLSPYCPNCGAEMRVQNDSLR